MGRHRTGWYILIGIVVGVAVLVIGGCFALRQLALWAIVGDAEDHIPPYNPNAEPNLPPSSVSSSIWGSDGIPATPIASKPHFIDHPTQQAKVDVALVEEAGCSIRFPSNEKPSVECDSGSPLIQFGCEHLLVNQFDIGFGLDPDYSFVATCYFWDTGVYDIGPLDAAHIFQADDGYVLVDSITQMQEMFAPITSSEEALAYAQLLTGLRAEYEFKPRFGRQMFLQEVIQDTHVTDLGHGYFVHLYHSPTLGCGPYITSQVDVIVGRDATITWMGATPVYIDLHRMCLD